MLTLRDSPPEAALRAEVRDWARDHLPDELRWRRDHDGLLEVDRRLSRAGLMGITWPSDLGGRGAPALLDAVLSDELGRAGFPRALAPSHQGVNNLAPALLAHADDDQKQRFLPPIRAVEELWCQGFSEPDAGSDLASLRTSATDAGDHLVVSGQKTWTSGAEHADWIYLLVRTGTAAERHRGITFVVSPMSAPGISHRPIRQVDGNSEFSEVFLDDVEIPHRQVIGGMGNGWAVTMTLLASERLSGRYRHGSLRREAAELAAEMAAAVGDGPSPWRTELGRILARIDGIRALSLRVDSRLAAGGDISALASINKLWWPAVHHDLLDLAVRFADHHGTDPSRWYERWLLARPESVYGGSAQIQRNVLAERHLGLPRSPDGRPEPARGPSSAGGER